MSQLSAFSGHLWCCQGRFSLARIITVGPIAELGERHGASTSSARSDYFLLFNDGGAIDVGVKDATDTKNRDAIRSHLPHIAMMFGNGNFDAPMLVHDSASVPGRKS